jgi:SAM-dependent methyltransferase
MSVLGRGALIHGPRYRYERVPQHCQALVPPIVGVKVRCLFGADSWAIRLGDGSSAPVPTVVTSLRQAWNEQAKNWAAWARAPDLDYFFWRYNLPSFLTLVPPPDALTLDLGCGEGRLGRVLCGLGHRVVGVDMGPLPEASKRDPIVEQSAAEKAGLRVTTMQLEHPRTVFYDVGAVVYFLRLVPWIVPDFTVSKYRDSLHDLHAVIQRDGAFETTASRCSLKRSSPYKPVT